MLRQKQTSSSAFWKSSVYMARTGNDECACQLVVECVNYLMTAHFSRRQKADGLVRGHVLIKPAL